MGSVLHWENWEKENTAHAHAHVIMMQKKLRRMSRTITAHLHFKTCMRVPTNVQQLATKSAAEHTLCDNRWSAPMLAQMLACK